MRVNVREVEESGVTVAIVIEFPAGLTGSYREGLRDGIERLLAVIREPWDLDAAIDYLNGEEG